MQNDSIQDSNRYVVGTEHHGDVIPGFYKEMQRKVYLKSGANILGSVYGKSIDVIGSSIRVEKTMFSDSDIVIDANSKIDATEIVFNSTVVARNNIITSQYEVKTKFMSDIYGKRITLNNSIVYGNVVSKEAVLDNCIVLGTVYSDSLKIKNSLIFSYNVDKVSIGDNLNIFAPVCFSKYRPELKNIVKAIPFVKIQTSEDTYSNVIEINETDIINVTDENNKDFYLLSIGERILNSTEVFSAFQKNKDIIESMSLFTQLQKDQLNELSKRMNDIETELWTYLNNNKNYEVIEAGRTYDELKVFLE